MRRRIRKIAISFALLLLALLTLAVAMPLWFPWMAKPVFRKQGIHYAHSQRLSYGRLALDQAQFANELIQFEAERIETLTPSVWMWRRYARSSTENRAVLEVTGWRVEILKRSSHETQSGSAHELLRAVEAALSKWESWLPKVSLRRGEVRFGKEIIRLPRVELDHRKLTVELESSGREASVHVEAGPSWPWRAAIGMKPFGIDATLGVTTNIDGLSLVSAVLWRSNRVDLEAHFNRTGWLPDFATLKSGAVRLPAKTIGVEEYDDISGELAASWRDGQFTVDLSAQASPRDLAADYPKVEAQFHARGDTNSVHIESARVAMPWLSAELSGGAAFDFTGKLLSDQARLELTADLSRQPWMQLSGMLAGEALIYPSQEKFPDTSIFLQAEQIAGFGVELQQLDLRGALHWPWFDLKNASAHIVAGGDFKATAQVHLVDGTIDRGTVQFEGRVGEQFLPAEYSLDRLALKGQVSGPIKTPSHSGHLEATGFKGPKLAPVALQLDWRGDWLNLQRIAGRISTTTNALSFSGAAQASPDEIRVRMNELNLQRARETMLALETPFETWLRKPAGPAQSKAVRHIEISRMHWRGSGGDIAVEGKILWPHSGNFLASIHKARSSLIDGWLEKPAPQITIDALDISTAWTNGPVVFTVNARAQTEARPNEVFQVRVKADGNAEGLRFENVSVTSGPDATVSGAGHLPLTLEPGRAAGWISIKTNAPLEFHAVTQPNTNFWEHVAQLSGVALRNPKLTFEASGAIREPSMTVRFEADQAEWKRPKQARALPRLEQLRFFAEINRRQLRLGELRFSVENQPVAAEGTIPLPQAPDLTKPWQELLLWQEATAKITVAHAQIAPFAVFAPELLKPQGTLDLDVTVKPKRQLEGELVIDGVATRPLLPFGAIQEIQARLKFSGQSLEIEKLSGSLGGEPITVAGRINLAERNKTTALPLFNLRVRGENIPLIREPEVILRSDVDITITNATDRAAIVSGDIGLRKSFF